jgi:hypothetical protein
VVVAVVVEEDRPPKLAGVPAVEVQGLMVVRQTELQLVAAQVLGMVVPEVGVEHLVLMVALRRVRAVVEVRQVITL